METTHRRTRSWPKRALAVAAVALLAAAGLAVSAALAAGTTGSVSVAAPGSDATIAAKTFSVDPGKVGDASVACPAGSRVVGGGVGQSQSTSPSFGYIQQSGPLDETGSAANTTSGDVGRSWSASVFNNTGAGVRTYWVFAICSATSDATIATNPFTVEPRTVNGASIDCPAGKRAVGGGLVQPGATSPLFGWVQGSGPVDASGTTANTDSGDVAEGWYASVFNFGSTVRNFRVYALCSADSDATIAAKVLSVAPGKVGEATVGCPTGRRVVGGGVGQSVALNTPRGYVQESGPADETGHTSFTQSGDVARSWVTSVYNPPEAGAPTREFRVFAVCASDAATQPTTTTTPRPTTTAPLPTTSSKPPAKPKLYCAGNLATIVGTAGNNLLKGTGGPDVIAGLGGNDRIQGRGGNDLICGGDGKDLIDGGAGSDYMVGDAGNDTIKGGPNGSDTLFGATGNDHLFGLSGNDRLHGGPGNDTLNGGTGNDRLYGDEGVDALYGDPADDILDGGPGQDVVQR